MAKPKDTATPAAPATPSITASMTALFTGKAFPSGTGIIRRNMPTMIKPGDIPIDAVVSGQIIKIIPSPTTAIKGKLLWLKHESGTEFTFPCTGVIRNALAPGIKDDDKGLDETLKAEVGKMFYAKRLPNKPSKFKKEMFMFDVFTSEKPVKVD